MATTTVPDNLHQLRRNYMSAKRKYETFRNDMVDYVGFIHDWFKKSLDENGLVYDTIDTKNNGDMTIDLDSETMNPTMNFIEESIVKYKLSEMFVIDREFENFTFHYTFVPVHRVSESITQEDESVEEELDDDVSIDQEEDGDDNGED